MASSEAPRRQSGVLQEIGRKDSVTKQVMPVAKNGRLSQVHAAFLDQATRVASHAFVSQYDLMDD